MSGVSDRAVKELDALPSLGPLYARAAVTAPLPRGSSLPETELRVTGVRVDRARLGDYAEVCGFRRSDALPPTYVHVLAFPLAAELMASRSFPFALPGLVHVGQVVEVHRPLTADDALDLAVRATEIRPHPKGRVVELAALASVDGELAWSGRSQYLRRGDGTDGAATPGEDLPSPPYEEACTTRWRVPGDTGRSYAGVAGDVNPIHLHPLSARLFGFPRAIAHGMWTMARALAALEGRLLERSRAEVRFAVPLLLPSTVRFGARPLGDGGWTLAVRRKDGAPHLTGAVTPLA